MALIGQIDALEVQCNVAVIVGHAVSRRSTRLPQLRPVLQPVHVRHRWFHAGVRARQRHGIAFHHAQRLR